MSSNKQTFFSKVRDYIIFLGNFGPKDMCTISDTFFGLAMSKPKVQFSMAIRNKIAKSFSMGFKRSIIIA